MTVTKAGGLLKMGGSLAAGRAGECTQSNPHLMIEAFLDHNDALLSTMAVTCSREAAEVMSA